MRYFLPVPIGVSGFVDPNSDRLALCDPATFGPDVTVFRFGGGGENHARSFTRLIVEEDAE